jgi:mannose-6-phosphate isomerase-like protein (cupin superfamily)
MKTGNFSNALFVYDASLVPFALDNLTFGKSRISSESSHLRFFYSTDLVELKSGDKTYFVPERSVIKAHPETPVRFNAKHGTRICEVTVLKNENSILEGLVSNNSDFFDGLEGKDKEEWGAVAGKDLDYHVESEKNSQHIVKAPGLVIAPAYSRFNPTGGWNVMYSRASRALGVAAISYFRLRANEAMHKHSITTETYICLDGSIELTIQDEKKILKRGDVVVAEPGDAHCETGLPERPYFGLVLQLPSIPGDKYTPEGVRFR